jgi:hypothetical protein
MLMLSGRPRPSLGAPRNLRQGLAAVALVLASLVGGCADYCPPDSEDFFCRYVVSIRPPDAIRQDLSDRPEPLRTDPRYPN